MMDKTIQKLNKQSEKHTKSIDKVLGEIGNVIVGQDKVLHKLLIALLANGHVLLEGVPGLAKTLMVHSLADTLRASFVRIQFTPDLLPADIVGTTIYDQRKATFTTRKGPVFANLVLADEINRAPPKVQSALLEAMQERQVSIGGETFPLPKPFLVLATQNPLETEGTYRLPEAQVDRFMLKVLVDYPSIEEERAIVDRFTRDTEASASPVLDADAVTKMQLSVRKLHVEESVVDYSTQLVDATRDPASYGLDMEGLIEFGASPRASIWLVMGARANALLNGRGYVIPEDIQAVAMSVLRHRIILTYEAEAEDVTTDDIVQQVLNVVEIP
ncbi:MAG: MoxR family ATPase [Candidatus Undinarchaeales archaeon]|jgi:MoxR-like ATPase|nr:MoxR family ATPase [Candidatus Undinarchaeales archaeon]MDP7493784.1 MoxR family ATPase [Candidatus Undinarchaeales archaeon]